MHLKIRSTLAVSMLTTFLAAGPAAAHETELPADAAVANQHAEAAPAATQQTAPVAVQQTAPVARGEIPERIGSGHWAYQEMSELVKKYAAGKKLPEGRDCTRAEMADCLLAVLDKIVDTYEKDGNRSLLKDDLEQISALQLGLERELTQQPDYLKKRHTIEEILALVAPETPSFEYKIGVNGFLRGEGAGSFRLNDTAYAPGHDEGRLLYRVKPYAYWHPTDYLELHLEGQGYGFNGASPSDNKLNLYQGFVEARIPGQDTVALKAGRQEFIYGSAFMQGSDTAFDGLTFDAVRLRVQPTKALSLDILGGRYVKDFSGGVSGNLFGAYLTYAPSEDSTLDVYALRDTQAEEHHSGTRLDSIALRSVTKLGPFGLEIEPIYQMGKAFNAETGNNEDVNAYGGHIDLTNELEAGGFKHHFLVSYAAGSGSQNPNREFRNPNNDSSLVGDMHAVGDLSGIDVGDQHASGMQVYTLGWSVELTDQLGFSVTGHKFVATSTAEGISRHIGTEADLAVTYAFNKDLSLQLSYDHMFTERFFKDASGSSDDIKYVYAMLTFNIDKTKKRAPKIQD
jgi:hypothetical protein